MTGQQLKLQGMSRAAGKHIQQLNDVQEYAKSVYHGLKRDITIEDVRECYEYKGRHVWHLGNAAGSVFAGKGWECVGYRAAMRPEARGRILRVWRLK